MINTKSSQMIYLILCLLVTNTFATPTDQDGDKTQAKPASQTAVELDDVFTAIAHNDIKTVKALIDSGFDFSQTNHIGHSPHNCARAHKWLHPEMFELIDSYVSRIAGHAMQEHKTNRTDTFFRDAAKTVDFDSQTPLMHAVRSGNYRRVLELYRNSTAEDLARTDSHGKTAADYISEYNCSQGNIDIALLFGKTVLAEQLRRKATDAYYAKHENYY